MYATSCRFYRILFPLALLATLATVARAQAFSNGSDQIPQGNPFNNSYTEEVNFADVDLDGDLDAAFADGGDFGNDQNRLWVNLGGLQGGTVGFFADVTSLQFPAVADDSRDIEFADIDGDGDHDLFVSNTSTIMLQPCRWWVNVGGIQGGSAGSYADETASRWVNIGVNDGTTTFSSIAPSLVLAGGGFVDWAGTAAFADFDNDGDLDLFHTTKGGSGLGTVPARIFRNDGAGFFEEFNPSHFQLSGTAIAGGDPALWAQGLQQNNTTDSTGGFADVAMRAVSVDVGDLDLDFDLDVIHGSDGDRARLFRNNSSQPGVLPAFTDITTAWFPVNWASTSGAYEQELGDLDLDGDVDLYGLNWGAFCDSVLEGNGDGTFGAPSSIANSCSDEEDLEFLDYDSDGDLDVLVANFSGSEGLYQNSGAPLYTLSKVVGGLPPDNSISRGIAIGDVDLDGDPDAMIANDANQADVLLINELDLPDAIAPRVARLEQLAARIAGANPTVVRAIIYDNTSSNIAAFHPNQLEYRIGDGAFQAVPLRWSGGSVFRGEIPGALLGLISYRVVAIDLYGNTTTSAPKAYFASAGGCTGSSTIYCTAKLNSLGCEPFITYLGAPSASGATSFRIRTTNVLNNKSGLLFYGLNGQQAAVFQGGYLCVKPPIVRTSVVNSGGNPPPNDCSGTYDVDFGARIQSGSDPNLVPGVDVDAQMWARDPGFSPPNNTSLSAGVHFTICP